jgi:hypothetical protein
MIHRDNAGFQFFRGAWRVEMNQIDRNSLGSANKVSIKVQEGSTESFNDIAKKLAENIYQSVHSEINEQISKEQPIIKHFIRWYILKSKLVFVTLHFLK